MYISPIATSPGSINIESTSRSWLKAQPAKSIGNKHPASIKSRRDVFSPIVTGFTLISSFDNLVRLRSHLPWWRLKPGFALLARWSTQRYGQGHSDLSLKTIPLT
jgi:hypothetical protein